MSESGFCWLARQILLNDQTDNLETLKDKTIEILTPVSLANISLCSTSSNGSMSSFELCFPNMGLLGALQILLHKHHTGLSVIELSNQYIESAG